jgi:predicted alpha/beta hydrolase family esterase
MQVVADIVTERTPSALLLLRDWDLTEPEPWQNELVDRAGAAGAAVSVPELPDVHAPVAMVWRGAVTDALAGLPGDTRLVVATGLSCAVLVGLMMAPDRIPAEIVVLVRPPALPALIENPLLVDFAIPAPQSVLRGSLRRNTPVHVVSDDPAWADAIGATAHAASH